MLLSVAHLSKSYGADLVLDDATFKIGRREKVALVGRNGTGKTTLLSILIGELEPDAGSVNFSPGATVGYLRQDSSVTPGRTVLEEVEAGIASQLEVRRKLEELEAQLEHASTPEVLDEYALIQEHYKDVEAYASQRNVRAVLIRMGFDETQFGKLTDDLSGGERTRLALARLLLERPELLIMDEPTNYLDIQASEWLEEWIRSYSGAALMVSHDREFLQATADRVLELRGHRIESFAGGFDQYIRLRDERDERQSLLAKRQGAEIAKLDEYVRRFINTQRTAQARGRRKRMEKLVAERVSAPERERTSKRGFGQAKRSGDTVLSCESLVVGYGDAHVVSDVNWTVRWQERWGVIGDNGSGKTTLIKTLLKKIKPLAGSTRIGPSVDIGYFSQDSVELDQEQSPLQFLSYECGMEAGAARDLLGQFLITGDDVFRKIRTLSGGEKNKLALARLTQLQPNLLVLDEPTNHLDMASREALSDVLRQYAGTLVLVSHDRWLLSRLVERILHIRENGVRQFLGTYQEFRAAERPIERNLSAATIVATSNQQTPHELAKRIRQLKKDIASCEAEVESAEDLVRQIEQQLAAPEPDANLVALTESHGEARLDLERKVEAWETCARTLEQLLARQG
ncbi:MAG: ABC-F family ATP-binding cassette domain-containing protein [Armatimonadetes bacterium]|nr:ABC-F family ATP-binding cassette domain-containing protein [Armatimonadota bacterium]